MIRVTYRRYGRVRGIVTPNEQLGRELIEAAQGGHLHRLTIALAMGYLETA